MEGTISSAYETSISTYTLDLGGEIYDGVTYVMECDSRLGTVMSCLGNRMLNYGGLGDGMRLEAGKGDVMPGKYGVTLRRLRRFMQAWEEMRIWVD